MKRGGEESPLVPDRFGQRLRIFDDVIRPVCAEFVCTTLFVCIGCLAIYDAGGDVVGVAVAHGFAICVLVIAFGDVSGAHINPAVTLGILISGNISWPKAIFYVAAQIAGGILGALIAFSILSFSVIGADGASMTAFTSIAGGGQMLAEGVSSVQGLLCEAFLTFILITVVLLAAVDSEGNNALAPIAIGFTVVADIIAGGNISGASMNPARSFGPAIIASGTTDLWTDQWIYWAGPIIGASVAGLIYRFFFIRPDKRAYLKPE